MTTKKGTIDEKATTKNQKMFCFRCGAEIPEKIKRKTDKYNTIKGRCPACKRTAIFITHAEMETENKTIKPETIEKRKIKTILEEEKEASKIIPSKVTASFNGKTVEMTGRIVAEKRKKGMPKTIKWSCERCDNQCIKKWRSLRRSLLFSGVSIRFLNKTGLSVREALKTVESELERLRGREDGEKPF